MITSRSVFLPKLTGAVRREAAEVFKLEAPDEDCILRLFRTDGTIVSNRVIKTSSGLKAWNIEVPWLAATISLTGQTWSWIYQERYIGMLTIDVIIVSSCMHTHVHNLLELAEIQNECTSETEGLPIHLYLD